MNPAPGLTPLPVVESVQMTVTATKVNAVIKINIEKPGTYFLLGTPAVLTEYKLNSGNLSIRHETAKVFSASIEKAGISTVVSGNGEVLTEVDLTMHVGKLSQLEMTLPKSSSSLWTVFADGRAASVSRVDDKYRIPLGDTIPGETTSVKFIYASEAGSSWFSNKEVYNGPRFDLPLKDIEWNFYVLPGRRYYAFDGTMQYEKESALINVFDSSSYLQNNWDTMTRNRSKAKSIMAESEKLVQKGEQLRARKALQSAINYAQGDSDKAFNEDARIQYKNLAEQQAVVGLVQRRDEIRYNMNIQEEGQSQRIEQFNVGNFTADYANKVQQQLSERETGVIKKSRVHAVDIYVSRHASQ